MADYISESHLRLEEIDMRVAFMTFRRLAFAAEVNFCVALYASRDLCMTTEISQATTSRAVHVVCGPDHSLFLTDDGHVFSCGLGADGQTGAGHFDCVGTPVQVGGDIQGEIITQLASSGDCVLALSDKGEVFGWGNSEYNQLSMVSKDSQVSVPRHLPMKTCGKVAMVAAGGAICGVVNEDGEVFVWGYGILGKGPNLEISEQPTKIPETLFGKYEFQDRIKVSTLRAGLSYFAAVTSSGDLYTWGKNRGGNLGFGHVKDQFFPLKVSVPAEVKDIRCGVDHMITLCSTFS